MTIIIGIRSKLKKSKDLLREWGPSEPDRHMAYGGRANILDIFKSAISELLI